MNNEEGITFHCEGEKLFGILHRPTISPPRAAVVLVVGGPQYRVGSHRQFVLLGRSLASSGIAVFRFDYRGMGDSGGSSIGFENIESDIKCAIDTMISLLPEVSKVGLWGLCDAASAIAMYAGLDPRVNRVVLVNPWVRTESGEAEVLVQSYYRQRILDPGAWKNILRNPKKLIAAFGSIAGNARRSFGRKADSTVSIDTNGPYDLPQIGLPDRVFLGLARTSARIRIILCEKDLTATEFSRASTKSAFRRELLRAENINQSTVSNADHTFSRAEWRSEVVDLTREWVVN